MALRVEQVDVEAIEAATAAPPPATSPQRQRNLDMERIRLEMRRETSRLERLWTD